MKAGGMIAVGLVAPRWLGAIAHADMIQGAQGGKIDPNCVLVVCQLSGGNDGLNTVIPYRDPRYRELRPEVGIPEANVLDLAEGLGFHPSLEALRGLYQKGQVAVIQGVGYPNPNRSHFKSMDIWQSASPDNKLKHGWVGRHVDTRVLTGNSNPVYAIGLSTERPLALRAEAAAIPCFASLADIQSMVGNPDAEHLLRQIQGASSADEKVVQQANKSALDAMAELQSKLSQHEPKQDYGKDKFGTGFRQVAQLVATSPQTRVIYFSAGGFDTHANQPDQHAALLKGFSDGVAAFQREMEALGLDKRVLVMVFSEFGRRAYENASNGTDHGAAGPMFLIGSRVKGGLYGPMPDLNNLENGDLRFGVDFREVYATALDGWLGGDSAKVLGGAFRPLNLLS